MILETNAKDFKEWLTELEQFENKDPEDMYTVQVSARLMCKILRKVSDDKA